MKNACPDRRPHLVALLYGEITEQERRRLQTHLAGCPDCRGAYQELIETRGVLAAWSSPPRQPEAPLPMPGDRPAPIPPALGDRQRFWWGAAAISRAGGLAAAALLVAAVALFFTLLEWRPGPGGALRPVLALGSPREAPDPPLTRATFEQGLAEVILYLEDRALQERRRQEQTVLSLLEEHLAERDRLLAAHLAEVVTHSFERLEQERRHDFQVVAAALDNLEYIAGTHMQRTNTFLAALLGERPGLPRE
jgi:hypothetical protein